MTVYHHKKGVIKDNAIEALLRDPLFKQRVEKNKKGKGSYTTLLRYVIEINF
ncbi:conserved hypothetical Protein [Photorhabdus asymbiotica]|uniref:Alternative ribosome-rescue factor A n=2 Tax=Photorhabdus asymbiotica TaxID=291112 RepID=C7BR68_PHOAA|nr:alternative ribosome-rescue factor [Photorhabdus asymbiotica]CAQ86276.1 conserved hypothetical Protein [Photorhabdus asymbiotica]